MKMNRNKIMGFIMAATMTFSLTGAMQTSAAQNTCPSLNDTDISSSISKDYPLLLWNLKNTPQIYGLSASDLNHVKLLSPARFITGDLTDSAFASKSDLYSLHFPTVNQSGKIIAIYTIIKTDDGVNATMGTDFAPMLESAKNSSVGEVFLVQDESGLMAVSNDGAVFALDGNKLPENRSALSADKREAFLDYTYIELQLDKVDSTYTGKAEQANKGFSSAEIESNTLVGKSRETYDGMTESTTADENNEVGSRRPLRSNHYWSPL